MLRLRLKSGQDIEVEGDGVELGDLFPQTPGTMPGSDSEQAIICETKDGLYFSLT